MTNRHGSLCDNDFDPEVIAWMKSHTVGDLRNLAEQMENKGENASGIMETVQVLERIELC